MIKDIEDIERVKSNIYDHLEGVRKNPKKRAHELVDLLENKDALDKLFGHREISKDIKAAYNREHNFYKAYIIHVFNRFIFDNDDVEIMLVAFNYHPDFEYETRAKYRRALFARQVYEPKHRRGWGDSIEDKDSGLRGEEARIMKELSERLAELVVKQGGTLDLIEDVLATFEPSVEDQNVQSTHQEEDSKQKGGAREDPQPDAPNVHPNFYNIHPHINIQISWQKISICGALVLVLLIGAVMRIGSYISRSKSVEENADLVPSTVVVGQIFSLPTVIVLPDGSLDTLLQYATSDPSLFTITPEGYLIAHAGKPGELTRTAEVSIQGASGATETKTVTVDFTNKDFESLESDIDNFAPSYRVEQRVRLAGTDEWKTNVENVKVGDLIEFRIKYTNTSEETQNSVMIKNILPDNLHYVPDSTVLTNAAYTLDIDQKTITTTGINIGHYEPGANAYVDFKAKVVDITLQDGSNTLVNWSQCGVGSVTLQDYATVQLYK